MAKTGSKLTSFSDENLSRLAAGGDQGAFLVLYDRYKTGVSLHVNQFVAMREEVEDIVLESFQKAFSQIDSYNSDYKFSTWLYRIARNTAFDHLQKMGRIPEGMSIGSLDGEGGALASIPDSISDPESDVIRSQEYDSLVSAIDGLSDLYREVARMILLDNYGYQEVAEAVNMPLNTVKTRVKRAREQIMRVMDSQQEDEL